MSRVGPSAIRAAVLELLAGRAEGASACPSEVARALDAESWRELMPAIREAAADMAAARLVRVTQGPAELEPDEIPTARGPVRLRRGPAFPDGAGT